MTVKREMIKKFLEEAYSGESQAHMKYMIFSEVAEKEGYPNVARLFRAIAFAELVHARNHYRALGYISTTVENLESARKGEEFEIEEMYPAYHNLAIFQEEREAEISTRYALEAEKIHEELYKKARESVEQKMDIEVKRVFICPVCGHTVIDEAPEVCPVCGAKKDMFVEF
jgi:rubrerythrin